MNTNCAYGKGLFDRCVSAERKFDLLKYSCRLHRCMKRFSRPKLLWALRAGCLIVAALFGLVFSAPAQWTLVWSDEFNGNSLNTNVWYADTGNCDGWGYGEMEYYTPQNLIVTNGMLRVLALNQPTNGFYFTSGRINSDLLSDCGTNDVSPYFPGSTAFTYGKIEWRIKFPIGKGLFPQIWMYPQNSPYVTWPNCGEIDVFEDDTGTFTNGGTATLHYSNGSGGESDYYCGMNGGDISQWHTYAIIWTSNSISFLTDGNTNGTCTNWIAPPGYSFPAPFNTPFFFEMNLAIGLNSLDVTPSEVEPYLPAEMDIDYIRVYEQSWSLNLTASQTNGAIIVSWPTNIASHLQELTNSGGLASSNGWFNVMCATNPYILSPVGNNFFRLVSP